MAISCNGEDPIEFAQAGYILWITVWLSFLNMS